MTWLIVAAAAWYLIGCFSFQYWWREQYDLDSLALIFMLAAGFMGPLAWPWGRMIHGGSGVPRVFLKRKGGQP